MIIKKDISTYQGIINKCRVENSLIRYETLNSSIIKMISSACLDEQFFVCGYCGIHIPNYIGVTNEHVIPQSILRNGDYVDKDGNPIDEFSYSHIIASCKAENQCDKAHRNKILSITPLDREWDDCHFDSDGLFHSTNQALCETYSTLKIGNSNTSLVKNRSDTIKEMLEFVADQLKIASASFSELNPIPTDSLSAKRYEAKRKDELSKAAQRALTDFIWNVPKMEFNNYGPVLIRYITNHEIYKSYVLFIE